MFLYIQSFRPSYTLTMKSTDLKCPDVYTIISRFLIHELEDLGITESPFCTGQVTVYSRLVAQNTDFITLHIYIYLKQEWVYCLKKR